MKKYLETFLCPGRLDTSTFTLHNNIPQRRYGERHQKTFVAISGAAESGAPPPFICREVGRLHPLMSLFADLE
jgi:hypothetical protein